MASSVKLSDLVPSRFAHLTPPEEANIERIRADLETGSKILLNNPHVFKNEAGRYELLAGHDRAEAARRAGWKEIPVRDFSGTLNSDDAILAHFCRENLLRKEISKAAIAGEWLQKHPEWMDTRIAEQSGCVPSYVGAVRGELLAAGTISQLNFRESETGEKRKAYKPRTPKLADPTKAKAPKLESAEEIAAALARPKQVAERKAPELRKAEASEPATGSSADTPEVGAPTGALLSPPGWTPPTNEELTVAGGVLDSSKSTSQSDAWKEEGLKDDASPEPSATNMSDVSPASLSAIDDIPPSVDETSHSGVVVESPMSREEQIAALRELQARTANPNARLPRRPPIPRLMEFVRVAVDLEEPSTDELDAIPANDLMLEHLERAHRIIGLILSRNGRSAAA